MGSSPGRNRGRSPRRESAFLTAPSLSLPEYGVHNRASDGPTTAPNSHSTSRLTSVHRNHDVQLGNVRGALGAVLGAGRRRALVCAWTAVLVLLWEVVSTVSEKLERNTTN